MGLGKFSSRGQVGLTAEGPGEVGLEREGGSGIHDCLLWYPFSHSSA